MPKTRQKKLKKINKVSPLKTTLLLIQFILLKIGQAELFILFLPWNILKLIFKSLKSLNFPKIQLSSLGIKTPQLLKHRGRPRNKWFIPYYLSKIKIYIKRNVSKKTKVAFAGLVIFLILYLYTSLVISTTSQLPNPKRLVSTDKALTTEFFDRNGKLLYRMYEGRNRTLIDLKELPNYLIQATLAAEDKNFYKHPGIDLVAIIRAALNNISNRPDAGNLEGASTLTQQLVKNALLTPEKTYVRKIKEIILSIWAERIYSKDEILSMYLNEAPYGGPAWGVEAASQTFFGKSAKSLTLAQATFLAGLPASPTQFSPYGSNPELGKVRQKEVLKRMVDNKFITQQQADIAFVEDLSLQPQINNIYAPHFVMYVKDLLSSKYGQRAVSQGGLKIYTTLDLNIQTEAENIVKEEVEKLAHLNANNGAAMITDGTTGQILAMVGSKDYHEPNFGSFNVTVSLRQPGSSIKVVTYATAFKLGYTPGNTILDVPVVFKDNWGNSYAPVNYDGAFHGAVSIRTALGSSYNIPAVKLLATIGIDEVIKTSSDLGITTFTDPKRYGLSLTLGGAEVKMVDMMTMYGSLSQNGNKHTTTPILKVTDSDGNILEEYQNKPTQALSSEVAYMITNILTDNSARTPAFGPKSLLIIPNKTVAVKTGTTDSKRDNWTFGYTPKYVVGVWVGNNNNAPMNPALTSGVTGAAPIWNRIMTTITQSEENLAFTRPSRIIDAKIDGRIDLAISSNIPKSLVRTGQKDDKILFSDSFSSFATQSAQATLKQEINN